LNIFKSAPLFFAVIHIGSGCDARRELFVWDAWLPGGRFTPIP